MEKVRKEKIRRLKDLIILVKGGGEMGTGVAHRLTRSGFRVCLTEISQPLAVRRAVSSQVKAAARASPLARKS